ncbi:TPA: tellurium resistance protein TerC [Candidatus Sumerlaeota bacterium]|jgi:tellurite resistance protein TerC|nr:tellurium resistance protein TerC [Candidatus Sumerlaeota bacterium]
MVTSTAIATATNDVVAGPVAWIILCVIVIGSIFFDLFVLQRKQGDMSFRKAIGMTCFWVILAALFNVGIYAFHGGKAALEFVTGYLVEYSLSVDNLFLFMVIFSFFGIKRHNQKHILFWGIFCALILRALFLIGGVALLHKFTWLIYVFGVILVYTAFKLAFRNEDETVDLEKSWMVRICRRVLPFPLLSQYEGEHFFTKQNGKTYATPLLLVLLIVELVDVVFAVDSIPAILAISTNQFVVFSSNAFAILGLRALFFVVSHFLNLFHYLHYGLAVILAFIGAKMLMSSWYHMPTVLALGVVLGVLAISILLSILFPPKEEKQA